MDIVDLLNRGAERAASLNDAVCLHKAAEQFLGAYALFEGYEVVAASGIAERVLGAAMILRPELKVSDAGPTVIFDVNIASGTQMARAARKLRNAGNAQELVGIALYSLVDFAADRPLGELSQLVVAHDRDAEESAKAQRSDRRDRCVGLALG
jgi:hypothetical protein